MNMDLLFKSGSTIIVHHLGDVKKKKKKPPWWTLSPRYLDNYKEEIVKPSRG